MKLEIGSGMCPRDGYLHTDIRQDINTTDVVCRGEQLPFKDASFEEVYSTGVFEHFTFVEALAALREWRRVLKPEGLIDFNVPDIYRWARYLVEAVESVSGHSRESGYDVNRILKSIYGWQGHRDDLHKWGWTEEHLLYEIEQAGFSSAEVYRRWAYSGEADAHLCVRAVAGK